ncbi:MAG: hypothetical protein FWC36_00140 [Spirochaetes bacterium]|nr:hypothetical protein [Spirochaetota bacterium]
MSDKRAAYNKCVNCGKYIETEIQDKSLFCSTECYEKYSSCNICSQYFIIENTHAKSLKCKIFFDTNQKKRPFIKQTMLTLFMFGNPLLNIELLSRNLSRVLKLPLFISEKFRIEDQFDVLQIKNQIKQKIEIENLQNYFIFLCNSHDTDFISKLFDEFAFDKIIAIESESSNEKSADSDLKLEICNNCENINSFFLPDDADENKCMICGSNSFRTSEKDIIIANKLKKYEESKSFIYSSTSAEKHINFTTEKVGEIVKHFVYT